MKNIIITFLITLIFAGIRVNAQQRSIPALNASEMELYQKFTELYKSQDVTIQNELNSQILDELELILKDPQSFEYHFDSLRWTGRIYSPDMKLRFITWNIPASNGTHTYYGFLQYYPKKDHSCMVFRLNDKSREISQPETEILSPEKWWGALYYQVLVNKYKGEPLYTVIGLDMNDMYSNKKIIDVLTFKDKNVPVFGRPVFRSERKLKNRVIFEFAEDVVMIVRYNEKNKMIVFDHLSPIDPALRNNPRYYAPDSSYDGFRFRKGVWEFIPDIDVRNP
jgi:hypothetical protein